MYLDSQFTIQGNWWLPTRPNRRFSGTLTCYQDGRVELDVLGTFFDMSPGIGDIPVLPIVLGISDKGKPITLVDCVHLNLSFNFPGMGKSKLLARLLLIGAHFRDKSKLTFSQLTFRNFGLDEWLGISGFELKHVVEKNTFDIHFTPPPIIEFAVSKNINLSFRFSWQGPSLRELNSVKLSHKAHLRIDLGEEKSIDDVITLIHRVKNFLSFAIGQPTSLREVSIGNPAIKNKIGKKSYLEQIEFYYRSIPSISPKRSFFIHEMTFGFQSIKDQFGNIIDSWLNMYEKLEPSLNLYFATLHNEGLYGENKFLGLIQGLETLHRQTTENRSIPQKEHDERIKRILSSVHQDYKKWLDERLTYSNEPPLRQRLKELIKPFEDLFGNNKKRKLFINKIVVTRNYLTHYDQRLKAQAAHGADLFPLNQKLQALFILHFLLHLGFSQDNIENIFKTSSQLQSLLRQS